MKLMTLTKKICFNNLWISVNFISTFYKSWKNNFLDFLLYDLFLLVILGYLRFIVAKGKHRILIKTKQAADHFTLLGTDSTDTRLDDEKR